jgi:hypothetical protein
MYYNFTYLRYNTTMADNKDSTTTTEQVTAPASDDGLRKRTSRLERDEKDERDEHEEPTWLDKQVDPVGGQLVEFVHKLNLSPFVVNSVAKFFYTATVFMLLSGWHIFSVVPFFIAHTLRSTSKKLAIKYYPETLKDGVNTQKFGNDAVYESWFDTNIFNPFSEKLVDPCHSIGLTPNAVTIWSKVFEVGAILLMPFGMYKWAALSYLFGYTLDCVDGKLARKYKLCSKYGMMLDFVSDMIAHSVIFLLMLFGNGGYFSHLVIIVMMSYTGNVYYGLVRAIDNVKRHGHDNFYAIMRQDLLDAEEKEQLPGWMINVFLYFHWSAYDAYKTLMAEYNDKRAHEYMSVLKYYGPGTFAMSIATILFFDLGVYMRVTVDEFFGFYNWLPSILVFAMSAGTSYIIYLHSGRQGRYEALNLVHYAGLAMGLVIMFGSTTNLIFSIGSGLFMFHFYYDMECRTTGKLYNYDKLPEKKATQ